jgi:CRISPR system Cascade subunit CasD
VTQYLTFSYVASLASFGSAGSISHRPTDDRPARSAVLGLLAGALGIDRQDDEAHLALQAGLFVGVRVEDMGWRARELLTDYHSTTTAKSGPVYHTRWQELEAESTTVILSHREFLQNVSYSVALWQRPGTPLPHTLEACAAALREPVYVPYAGRKCCPFSLPLNPIVVEADTVRQAFERWDEATKAEREFRKKHWLEADPSYVAVDAGADEVGLEQVQRRDRIVSRVRWQFWPREEVIQPW